MKSVLPKTTAVVRDQSRCDREDVAARAIISFESDHLRAGKVPLEPQDVFDVGAAPGVDRLIVVADAAQIAVCLGEEAKPKILDDVGVLVLVDQDVAEPPPVRRENVVVFAQEPQRLEQEIAEIDGVERFQARLIALVERRAAAAGEYRALRSPARAWGRLPQFFHPSMRFARARAGQRFSSRFSACRSCLSRRSWSSESRMVKLWSQAHELGVHAQDLRADRMEGAEPRHGLLGPGERADALAHLPRRLVGERHRQNLIGASAARGDEVGDSGGQHAGFADACAGENEDRPVQRLDRALLLLVQAVEIGVAWRRMRAAA